MYYEEEEITVSENTVNIDAELKADRKKYFKRILFFIILNTILVITTNKPAPEDISVIGSLMIILFANLPFIVAGFISGIILAALPYKNLAYSKKYVRISLKITYVLLFMMALLLLFYTISVINRG